MEHELKDAGKAPPFKFAVLFSSTMSISPDQTFGQDYMERYAKYYDYERDMTKESRSKTKAPKSRTALVIPGQKQLLVQEFQDLVAQGIASAIENGDIGREEAKDVIKDIDSFPRVFHPFMCTERVSIPTVHISGREDPYKMQSDLVRKLCEKPLVKFIEHGGAHQVPRATRDVKKVVDGIEWAIQQASVVRFQY
jgi:hypothetical protein